MSNSRQNIAGLLELCGAVDGQRGGVVTPAGLMKAYYSLDDMRQTEWLAYLEELCEEQRAAKRGEAATICALAAT